MITVLGSAEVKGTGLRRESREGWGPTAPRLARERILDVNMLREVPGVFGG
jgi:hypothetical protein